MKTDNVPFVLITVWSFPHSWIIVFVLCFFSSSCVPYVASFSELSFFDPLRYSLTFIYHRVCIKSNTTGATCETGTTYPSGVSEFTIVFLGVRVARFLVFCVMFCRSLFVLFLLAIFGARVAEWARSLDLTAHTSLSPIRRGFVPSFVNYKKGCTRLAAASDKVYQLLAQGRWFSPASSTTKTGCHDIAEILLKVALKHQKKSINQSINQSFDYYILSVLLRITASDYPFAIFKLFFVVLI